MSDTAPECVPYLGKVPDIAKEVVLNDVDHTVVDVYGNSHQALAERFSCAWLKQCLGAYTSNGNESFNGAVSAQGWDKDKGSHANGFRTRMQHSNALTSTMYGGEFGTLHRVDAPGLLRALQDGSGMPTVTPAQRKAAAGQRMHQEQQRQSSRARLRAPWCSTMGFRPITEQIGEGERYSCGSTTRAQALLVQERRQKQLSTNRDLRKFAGVSARNEKRRCQALASDASPAEATQPEVHACARSKGKRKANAPPPQASARTVGSERVLGQTRTASPAVEAPASVPHACGDLPPAPGGLACRQGPRRAAARRDEPYRDCGSGSDDEEAAARVVEQSVHERRRRVRTTPDEDWDTELCNHAIADSDPEGELDVARVTEGRAVRAKKRPKLSKKERQEVGYLGGGRGADQLAQQ